MNDDTMQPLEPRISGEFLVRRKRRRLGVATDPGLGFYVPSSPTSADANLSSETAEPRSASSENYKISHDPPQGQSPMEVDDQPPPGTLVKSNGSPTPTPTSTVEGFLRKSARGSRKRQKLKHVDFGHTPHDTSPTGHRAEDQHSPTITRPLTSTVPRRKRRTRSRSSRVKATLVKGKAYRTRSQKPKAVTDDIVRAALSTHVDVDDDTLEDGGKSQYRLDLGTSTNGLTQNTPATFRRRNLVHPSKTQPFPCEPSLGNISVDLELGRHPRKPMTAWEGVLGLSKLDIQIPTSTVTPRRKGRPIQGSSSRIHGRYPKLPLTPLTPTPMPTSRGHVVPRSRLRLQRGQPRRQTHPEVTAIPIISAEEITTPNSEPGSEHELGSSTQNPTIHPSNHGIPAPSYKDRARAGSAAVTNPSHPEPRANPFGRRVRFSSPLAPDSEGEISDDPPIVLVPNSSDPNLANRVNPNPSNLVSQPSPSPPPFPSPRLLFVQSRPHSPGRTLDYHASVVDSDGERKPKERDALVPPITVWTQPKTADDNGEVVSDGENLKGREGAENVHQHQFGVDSPLGSQDPAETLLRNVEGCIERQDVQSHSATIAWESNMRRGDGVQQSPSASHPVKIPDSVENPKPMKPLKAYFDHLTDNARRVESEARSKLQAEVEGDKEDNGIIGTSRDATASNGPSHPTPFPILRKMLSLLDESGPSRSSDGLGRVITRRPKRPNGGSKYRKLFQTQPPAEVERGWQSEGPSNANARPGAGASNSDDLSFFAGL